MLSVAFLYCKAECQYAECRYAGCHYAECRGAPRYIGMLLPCPQTLALVENNLPWTNALAYFLEHQ
jgi:hypothetical protein